MDVFQLLVAKKLKPVLALLRRNAKALAARNERGSSVLMAAAYFGLDEVVSFALDHGLPAAEVRADGFTALILAAQEGHARIVDRLIAAGANVNARAQQGQTALTLALEQGHDAVVGRLLRAGADPKLKGFRDVEAIDIAIRRGATAIVQQLVAAGAKPGKAYGKAIDDGNAELVLALVEAGADPKPAAKWAAQHNATNVIAQLRARGVTVPAAKGPPVELLSHAEATAFLKARRIKVTPWWPSAFGSGCAALFRGNLRLRSLRLDHGFPMAGKGTLPVGAGLIVDGTLTIDGAIENGEQDFGPFLVTTGDLVAHDIAVGGATLHVGKHLRVRGAFHGYYNHGMTTVAGDVDVPLFIADDYSATFAGKVRGHVLRSMGYVKSKTKLPPEPDAASVLAPAYLDDDQLRSEAIFRAVSKGKRITAAKKPAARPTRRR